MFTNQINMHLIDQIKNIKVNKDEIALFFLGQAGFCIKTDKQDIVIIDPYLSDAAERLFNFKRMIPSLIAAENLHPDLFLSTHSHIDHLDIDTISVVAKNNHTIFVGAPDCLSFYEEINLSADRRIILKEKVAWQWKNILIRGTYADHGELAPEAIGFLIVIDGIRIYHAGDTCFCPDEIMETLLPDIDIMIVPINGQYGNMTASEALKLIALIKPKISIACHFWMFLEHVCEEGKGDPATFIKESENLPIGINARVMAPGELLIYKKNKTL